MIYPRTILFYLGEALSTIPFLMVAIIALLTPPTRRSKLIAGWAKFVTWWLKVTCGLSHKLEGIEHMPKQPCVFACAHQSTWETITTQTFLPPLAWVLKKELLRIPVFGLGLRATGPIAIDRSDKANTMDQVVKQGCHILANENRHVLIFPEGTRAPYGKSGRYKKGAAKLAIAANVPIIPIAHDAGKFWERDNWWIKSGEITCRLGPPISVEGKTDTQVTQEIQAWIEAQAL